MRIELAYVSSRRQRLKSAAAQALVEDFTSRATRYTPTTVNGYDSEADLLAVLDRSAARTPPFLVALDSRGEQFTSERFAERLQEFRDGGLQQLTLAVGPADGWSSAALGRARLQLSLGRLTLPHELALAILAEQVYRALTILAGHPYHGGHGAAPSGALRDLK